MAAVSTVLWMGPVDRDEYWVVMRDGWSTGEIHLPSHQMRNESLVYKKQKESFLHISLILLKYRHT